jgi:hypothetical protein
MDFYWFLLAALATWRITHLLSAEDGPWNLLASLRRILGTGFWATLVDCFYCLSLWVALPLAFVTGHSSRERLLLWPALSAAAIVIERLTKKEPPVATYFEDEEVDDGLLRKREGEGEGGDDGAGDSANGGGAGEAP